MAWLKKLLRDLISSKGDEVRYSESEEYARPANWTDVFGLTHLLEEHDVKYILVGGYALNFNGIVRNTSDIDILVKNDPENNKKWIAALSELPDGVAKSLLDRSEDPFFIVDEYEDGVNNHIDVDDPEPGVIRVVDQFVVDVMPKTCGKTYDELLPHSSHVMTGSGVVSVLDLNGLLLTKQGIREKDAADRKIIKAAMSKVQNQVSEHVKDMGRRSFLQDDPLPPNGEYEIRLPDDDQEPVEDYDSGIKPR